MIFWASSYVNSSCIPAQAVRPNRNEQRIDGQYFLAKSHVFCSGARLLLPLNQIIKNNGGYIIAIKGAFETDYIRGLWCRIYHNRQRPIGRQQGVFIFMINIVDAWLVRRRSSRLGDSLSGRPDRCQLDFLAVFIYDVGVLMSALSIQLKMFCGQSVTGAASAKTSSTSAFYMSLTSNDVIEVKFIDGQLGCRGQNAFRVVSGIVRISVR
jgi:hypothetical protein